MQMTRKEIAKRLGCDDLSSSEDKHCCTLAISEILNAIANAVARDESLYVHFGCVINCIIAQCGEDALEYNYWWTAQDMADCFEDGRCYERRHSTI
jgi:hypothetical protein